SRPGRRPLSQDRHGPVPALRYRRRSERPLGRRPAGLSARRSAGADRLLHGGQPHLLAGSADLLRHDRLRRRWPAGDRIRRSGAGRSRGRPPRAHGLPHQGRGRPARLHQIFLEGGSGNRWRPVMARGIRDRVAILGMGCARFGERWGDDADTLMVEAYEEAIADAGIDTSRIEAAWLGVAFDAVNVGPSGIPLAMALRLPNIGVTRVENYCASGTESFRGAVYAVASGAADIALALGVEKLKDTGYGGLPVRSKGTTFDMVGVTGSAPGNFAQL